MIRSLVQLCAIAFCGSLLIGLAAAQDDAPLVLQTGKELLEDTALYVGRTVVVVDGYCFYDQPNFVCIGTETPFEVKAPSMAPGPIQAAIKENCGDIEGTEHNPTPRCAYSFRFVPRSFKPGIGDYILHDEVQSNKRLVYFQTDSIEPLTR